MRPLTLAAGALAALALAAPASATEINRNWSESWDVSGVPVVRIVTDDARVRIHRGEPGKVSARVQYHARAWGLGRGGEPPKVVLTQEDGVVRIDAHERAQWVVFGGLETRFEVDVTVPANCDLSARSGDGSITCDPLEGRITLESGDGRIRANGLHGTLVLWSGDGSIEADSLDGSLMARSADGGIRLTGRFDDLDVQTGDGRLQVSAARGSRLASGWSLESGDGSILFRIPRNLQAMLDARSRDGQLRIDLPVTTTGHIRNNSLVGQLNGGSKPLRLRSGDGSITLGLSE